MEIRMRRNGPIVAVFMLIAAASAGSLPAEELPFRVPLGLQPHELLIPEDNPMTAEKIALGKQLFFDSRWSRTRKISCSSCHDPAHGWADPRPLSVHGSGETSRRRSQTIVNRALGEIQHRVGDRKSLEDHAMQAADSDPETVVKHIGAIPGYQEQFQRVFGTPVTADGVAKAIAAFERAVLSGNSPFDRHRAGDRKALAPAARRGLALFEGKAGCAQCHTGSNFTDESFHNLGVGMDRQPIDLGRYEVVKIPAKQGAFKTPTLRDVARRPPYMHDGSLRSLREVVTFYNGGGKANPLISLRLRPLRLSDREQADLAAFLEALTGEIDPRVTRLPALPPDP